MEKVTKNGEITFKDGIYYVWNETYSETLIATPDVDLAFEILNNSENE